MPLWVILYLSINTFLSLVISSWIVIYTEKRGVQDNDWGGTWIWFVVGGLFASVLFYLLIADAISQSVKEAKNTKKRVPI